MTQVESCLRSVGCCPDQYKNQPLRGQKKILLGLEARVLNLLRVFLYKLQNFKLEEFSIKLIAETFHFADVDVIYPKVPIHILATSNLF